ncbi:MAG: sigma-70 family RNA polymerase sigma factor [Ginsengibacter sp.]
MKERQNILTETVFRAAQGAADAQGILYDQFSKAMYNICLRMAGNKMQAEDLLHDCFMIAFKSLKQLKDANAFPGWLRRIVVNECIKQSRYNFRFAEQIEIPDVAGEIDNNWWENISLEMLNQEIKGLPDGCRQVFVLYVLEDFSHSDIAGKLGCTEGTSKSQYHRSRSLLRERITKKMELQNG